MHFFQTPALMPQLRQWTAAMRVTTAETPRTPVATNDPYRSPFPPVAPAGKVVVIIPAFNEERFIGSVVLKALKQASTVIVIDDGSNDATADVAEMAGALVVRHPANQGKGAALNTGFCAAHNLAPDAIVVIDGDGQHLPEEMSYVLAPVLADQADIVVGSRYLEQRSDVPRHRVLGHRVFNLLTNVASGVSASDSQSGFRAFSTRAMEAICFSSTGFSVESEMQFLARDLGLRFQEVPITIRYQDKPKRNVIAHGLLVLNGMLRLIGQHRPLFFFSVPGLILLMASVMWGVIVMNRFDETHQLATGYALMCILFAMSGLVLVSTGFTLHSMRGLLLDFMRVWRSHK
jgi:glycosyltransferase involved in cell wall biosynthesis